MSQPQYHLFKSTDLCAKLQASGLPSDIQIDIVSVPLSQLGLNNRSIYGTQGKKHICEILDHGSSYTTTVNHLQDMIESQNLDIGCSGPLFANKFQALYQCIPPYWISQTWQFMREKLSIEETRVHLLTQRHND